MKTPALWAGLLHRFARPDDSVERLRWLFLLYALLALVLTAVPTLVVGGRTSAVLVCASWVVLNASWCTGYLRRSDPLRVDLLGAVAVLAFTAAAPVPQRVLGFTFGMLWFRSSCGSTPRAFLRCALYQAGLLGGALLWSRVPGHGGAPDLGTLLGTFPLMVVNIAVIRFLLRSVTAGARAAQRDAALTVLGTDLLGATGAAEVQRHARRAAAALCAATPGLRLVLVTEDAGETAVRGAWGAFASPPQGADGRVLLEGTDVLDALAGERCTWERLALPHRDGTGWVLAGVPASAAPAMAAVHLMVGQVALALSSAQARDQLVLQASTDPLTGLANRSASTAAVERACAAPGSGVPLFFIDLDDFKGVNDRWGHVTGDALLKTVAARLRTTPRAGGVCARLGGDEFAVLLTGVPVEAGRQTAERLVEVLRGAAVLDGHEVRVGASIGVAHTARADVTPEDPVHRADTAMYAAKAQGKGRVEVSTDEPARPGAVTG